MLLLSAQYALSKVRSSERDRKAKLLAAQERAFRKAFLTFVADLRSKDMRTQITQFLKDSNQQAALKLVDQHIVAFARVIPNVFIDVARKEIEVLARKAGFMSKAAQPQARVSIAFDASNPRAANLMRTRQLSFVQQISNSQRAAVRQSLADSFNEGSTSLDSYVDAFMDSLGLTDSQVATVNNYRTLLESGSEEALQRDLRDRRYDRTVQTAFTSGEPIPPKTIDTMVGRYEANMLAMRAETIGRTEGLSVMNEARHEAMDQVIDQAGFERDTVRRTWNATQDSRTRDSHLAMDGQTVGMDEPFVTPSGEELMFPGDPDASAKERINCRCTVTLEFD